MVRIGRSASLESRTACASERKARQAPRTGQAHDLGGVVLRRDCPAARNVVAVDLLETYVPESVVDRRQKLSPGMYALG